MYQYNKTHDFLKKCNFLKIHHNYIISTCISLISLSHSISSLFDFSKCLYDFECNHLLPRIRVTLQISHVYGFFAYLFFC